MGNLDKRLAGLENISREKRQKTNYTLTLLAKIQALADREPGAPVGTVSEVISVLLVSPDPARRRIGQILDNAKRRSEARLCQET